MTWRSSPATGSCPLAAWMSLCASCAQPRPRWRRGMTAYRSARCASTRDWTQSSTPKEGMPRSPRLRRSPPRWGCPSACWGSRCGPCRAGNGAESSCRASCSRARRPCCSTSRLTTWMPTRSPGFGNTSRPTRVGWSSSPTTWRCSTPSSTESSTWMPTGPSSTSTTSGGSPTSCSVRPTSGAGVGSGSTPRRRRRR